MAIVFPVSTPAAKTAYIALTRKPSLSGDCKPGSARRSPGIAGGYWPDAAKCRAVGNSHGATREHVLHGGVAKRSANLLVDG